MTLMIWWRPDHPSWHDVEWPTCLQNTIICTNYQQSCSGDGRVRGPKQTKVDRRCKHPKCDFMTEIKEERKVDTWKNDTDVQHREYKQDAGWDFRPRIVNDVFWLEKSMRVRTEDKGWERVRRLPPSALRCCCCLSRCPRCRSAAGTCPGCSASWWGCPAAGSRTPRYTGHCPASWSSCLSRSSPDRTCRGLLRSSLSFQSRISPLHSNVHFGTQIHLCHRLSEIRFQICL